MTNPWTVFAAILILNALLALALAALLSRTRSASGRRELALALILLAVWAFCYAMIALSTSLEAKHFWLKMENVGITLQPVFWLLFTLNYVRRNRPVKLTWVLALCIVPTVTLTLLFPTAGFPSIMPARTWPLPMAGRWSSSADCGTGRS